MNDVRGACENGRMTAVRSLHSRGLLTVLGAALATVLALVWATPAWAHTDLSDSTPVTGETVTALDGVRLQFTGALLELGAELTLIDPAGESTALEVKFPEPTVVAASVESVVAGEYTLQWRVVAEDGHPIEGEIPFTADVAAPEPAASPSPAVSAASTPSADAGLPSPSAIPGVPEGTLGTDAGSAVSPMEAVLIAVAGAMLVTLAWLGSRMVRGRREDDPL